MPDYASVDCAKGREMGCQTFCCRLLVRLDGDERTPSCGSFVAKDADGYCNHLNRDDHLCRVWHQRSRACRRYDCNNDFLLQVALRNSFDNIVELARLAATAYIPRERYIKVPAVQGRTMPARR